MSERCDDDEDVVEEDDANRKIVWCLPNERPYVCVCVCACSPSLAASIDENGLRGFGLQMSLCAVDVDDDDDGA